MGDVRDDGYIFSQYKPDGSPIWYSPPAFLRLKVFHTLKNAKRRSRDFNVPFDADADYLVSIFPQDGKCPALGVDLVWGEMSGRRSCPSLDRIEPSLGYVRGNLQWISQLANAIKSNATTEEICAVAAFMKAKDASRKVH